VAHAAGRSARYLYGRGAASLGTSSTSVARDVDGACTRGPATRSYRSDDRLGGQGTAPRVAHHHIRLGRYPRPRRATTYYLTGVTRLQLAAGDPAGPVPPRTAALRRSLRLRLAWPAWLSRSTSPRFSLTAVGSSECGPTGPTALTTRPTGGSQDFQLPIGWAMGGTALSLLWHRTRRPALVLDRWHPHRVRGATRRVSRPSGGTGWLPDHRAGRPDVPLRCWCLSAAGTPPASFERRPCSDGSGASEPGR
jgi:hypothetical protein